MVLKEADKKHTGQAVMGFFFIVDTVENPEES